MSTIFSGQAPIVADADQGTITFTLDGFRTVPLAASDLSALWPIAAGMTVKLLEVTPADLMGSSLTVVELTCLPDGRLLVERRELDSRGQARVSGAVLDAAALEALDRHLTG